MKVAIPVDSEQKLGGGFTFRRNLIKGLQMLGSAVEIVDDPLKADVAVICGVTMVSKETFRAMKSAHVKIVTRLDNVPRNSRNRGSGTGRLLNYAQEADELVWQGEWSKFYLEDFLGSRGVIIHNGIDLDVFNPVGDSFIFEIGRAHV